ncbi:MAG: S-methyl-5-thioribose-1-phosphate isomerase [Bacteroidia bacterium]|nr:S-methyl-5-thioribose-1-phosphate isomerase [Bacteroidia bacterium]
MNVNGKHYETIWLDPANDRVVVIIDQRYLPFRFTFKEIRTVDEMFNAIRDMAVRGAPLIGAAAAFGIYLAVLNADITQNLDKQLQISAGKLLSSRPTAINLQHAIDFSLEAVHNEPDYQSKILAAKSAALEICRVDKENCRRIGENGLGIIKEMSRIKGGEMLNILTHCNAGWLACIDYGTALAPVYFAHDRGIKVHVWVDETRPRNQGSRLTAWELGQHGVPHTVIPDNTGGHLMQHGLVDMVIVGSDRTTANGDVANKVGTYLKALSAMDNNIPFYVALSSSTIDWDMTDGIAQIPIEERDPDEVAYIGGLSTKQHIERVRLIPVTSHAMNFAFDVTPARLVTALITERGICKANRQSLSELFPERQSDIT